MTSHAVEILNTYLLPLAIALAFVVLVGVLRSRRGDDAAPPAQPVADEGATTVPAIVPAAVSATRPATVALPPAAQPVAQAVAVVVPPELQPAPPAPPPPLQPAVLVVDDSAVVRAKLKRLFEGAGWQVGLARDGHEALQVLEGRAWSVLVTDLEMPGMDGFELIAAVQGALATERLPIVAITGHSELQARVHALQGLYGLFPKPWNDRELLRRVETLALLHRAPAEAAAAAAPAASTGAAPAAATADPVR